MTTTETIINLGKIETVILFEQGMTAEMAVLKAFNCDLRIVKTIKQLQFYTNNFKSFTEAYTDEDERKENFPNLANNPSTITKHQDIVNHKVLMKKLSKLLLTDIHHQVDGNLDKGLIITKSERLSFIRTEESIARLQKLDTEEDIPETEPLLLDYVPVSYSSLYTWFKKYDIEVKAWKNLTEFQKQPFDSIVPPKKSKPNLVEYSKLAFFGAVLTELFKTKTGTTYRRGNDKLKMDVIAQEFIDLYDGLKGKSTIKTYIRQALDEFETDCEVKNE